MKKKLIIAVTLLLITFGVYQGTLAIFHEETNIDSPISAGKLGIEIVNASQQSSSNELAFDNILPGSIVDHGVGIRNSKDKDLYVRITLTRYWTDKDGKKIVDADASYIKPITSNATNWIMFDDGENSNNEIIYYYYKLPLSANDVTSNVIDQVKFDEHLNDIKYSGYKANVKIEAEAVQKAGAADAMLSQWGMDITFNQDGSISQVEE